MFAWLKKNREAKAHRRLERSYRDLLERARDLQRGGDIEGFAHMTAKAEEVREQLDALEAQMAAAEAR